MSIEPAELRKAQTLLKQTTEAITDIRDADKWNKETRAKFAERVHSIHESALELSSISSKIIPQSESALKVALEKTDDADWAQTMGSLTLVLTNLHDNLKNLVQKVGIPAISKTFKPGEGQ